MTTQRELQLRLANDYGASHDRIASLVRPLDPERLVRRPAPGRWSVGEVLEHLTLMDQLFLGVIEPMVRKARPDAAAPARPWSPTFVGKQIVGSLQRPKRLKSPKVAVPGTPRAAVREAFLAGDSRYTVLLATAASLHWNAIRLRPPVAPWIPLKMNLGDVFSVHDVHVKRHLAQIERVIGETQ